jgi:hypothetical protein
MKKALARRAIDTMKTDRCRITTDPQSVEGTLNEDTFEIEYPPGSIIYEGACQLTMSAGNRETNDGVIHIDQMTLSIPSHVEGVRKGQVVVFLESDDPMLTNQQQTFEVDQVSIGTNQLSRHVGLKRRNIGPTTGGE